MEIYFSRHVKRQMKWRKISEDEVKATVLYPSKTEDSMKGRKNAFRCINNKWLKVTFIYENNKIIIITAINKTKRKKGKNDEN
ncbi:DUF4258 domain-containing protein [Candidatus Magnetomoraceae bacterium gMMP-15]